MWMVRASMVVLAFALGCASESAPSEPPQGPPVEGGGAPIAELLELDRGVPDRGRDPAVLAIDVEGMAVCSGALIAPEVVLTARRCVSVLREGVPRCAANQSAVEREREPAKLALFAGDDVARAELVARGREFVVPAASKLCGLDLALIRLDRAVAGIAPMPIRRRGVAVGDRVRTIGFGASGADEEPSLLVKLRREPLRVTEATANEFVLADGVCGQRPGMPAVDPDSGAIVGVFSGAASSRCEGADARDVYTRIDAHLALVEHALHRARGASSSTEPTASEPPDGGANTSPVEGPADAGPVDAGAGTAAMGEPCQRGADCVTAICASYAGERYCSRECGGGRRCPAGYRCTAAANGMSVCKRN